MAKRKPIIGESFNPEYGNLGECATQMARELEYYRPHGFARLRDELESLSEGDDISEAIDEACELLTDWARRVARHDFISFRCEGDFAGFAIDVESAQEDSDLRVDDLADVPRGFSGLVSVVSDHGNVTAYAFSRGRKRELFAVV